MYTKHTCQYGFEKGYGKGKSRRSQTKSKNNLEFDIAQRQSEEEKRRDLFEGSRPSRVRRRWLGQLEHLLQVTVKAKKAAGEERRRTSLACP